MKNTTYVNECKLIVSHYNKEIYKFLIEWSDY